MRTLPLAALALTLSGACAAETAPDNPATVTIGTQVWLARNLDATHFANGDAIPRITGEAQWAAVGAQGRPAQSAYANDEARVPRDGLLYNYAAIADPRGLCPKGFRIPTDTDWSALEATLGKDTAATRMKTRAGWPITETGSPGNGTDDVGFGGLPAGFRTQRGDFFLGDRVAYFWSLTELSPTTTTAHMLFDYDAKIFRIEYDKAMGMSVRCLKA
jgi:uncharacterized protein (TIGR02145 family)